MNFGAVYNDLPRITTREVVILEGVVRERSNRSLAIIRDSRPVRLLAIVELLGEDNEQASLE